LLLYKRRLLKLYNIIKVNKFNLLYIKT